MLARSGEIPAGPSWSFELKWDGFRALVARNGDFRVRSRRGWDMTALLPELADLPVAGTFDGEIIAWDDGRPYFPLVCQRLFHGDWSVPLTFVIFEVLELDGDPTMPLPYVDRRRLLDDIDLGAGPWILAPVFRDGEALFAGVVEQGLEGIVCKRRSQPYRPGERGWIKVKNRDYWRYAEELNALRRSFERARANPVVAPPTIPSDRV
jgi:bifunctional non-homologous end joining protein LigD